MFDSLTSLKLMTLGMVFLGTATLLNSQDSEEVISQEATVITLPAEMNEAQSPEERLAAIRAINEQLIAKQRETLLKLEKLETEAAQLRIFARRS